ncbi:MAG: hypothetical protein JWO59_1173, partial [Chloroflexi bacterium]|nr:hypothetical protein [Chloroflexota bacterium]
LSGLPGGAELRRQLHEHYTLAGCLEVLDRYQERGPRRADAEDAA